MDNFDFLEDEEMDEEAFDAFLSSLMASASQATTLNYEYACTSLRNIFFNEPIKKEELTQEKLFDMLNMALNACAQKGYEISEEFCKIGFKRIDSEDGAKTGYITNVNDCSRECDCNFVGLIFDNGKKRYFTSEYYQYNGSFGFCEFLEDGSHVAYGEIKEDYQSFVDEILRH